METYKKNHKEISYLIEHKPIKNTYFRVKDNYVHITTSKWVSKKQILAYLDFKFEKFHQSLTEYQSSQGPNHIRLWGRDYVLKLTHGRFSYHIQHDHVYVTSTASDYDEVKKRIYYFEMVKRLDIVHSVVEEVIKTKHIDRLPIRLKYLKSKFGSYHRKHQEITINTFLATLEKKYLYYVLFHEYAHARVFNHSKDFYNLLDDLMPNHRIYQKDLKKIAII